MLNKEQVIKEIVRCGKDPNYFIENYVRISHPEKGPIPFRTYPFQKDLLQDYNAYRFNIILKGRQLGISTVTAAYAAWLILFHREKNILVIATKLSTAGNLVKKVKFMIKNLPPWLQIADIAIDNRNSFELSNGSQIKASSTSETPVVQKPFHFLLLTRLLTLMVWTNFGKVYTPHYQLVVVVLLFQHQTASATGFIVCIQMQMLN